MYSNRATKPKGMMSTTAKKNFHIKSLKLYNCRLLVGLQSLKESCQRQPKRIGFCRQMKRRTAPQTADAQLGQIAKYRQKLNLEKIGKLVIDAITRNGNDVYSCLQFLDFFVKSHQANQLLTDFSHLEPLQCTVRRPRKTLHSLKKGTYKTNCFFSIVYYTGAYIIVSCIHFEKIDFFL